MQNPTVKKCFILAFNGTLWKSCHILDSWLFVVLLLHFIEILCFHLSILFRLILLLIFCLFCWSLFLSEAVKLGCFSPSLTGHTISCLCHCFCVISDSDSHLSLVSFDQLTFFNMFLCLQLMTSYELDLLSFRKSFFLKNEL